MNDINWFVGMNYDEAYLRFCKALGIFPNKTGQEQYRFFSEKGMDCNGIDFRTVDITDFILRFNEEKKARGVGYDKMDEKWPTFTTTLANGWACEDHVAAWLTQSSCKIKKGQRWMRYHTDDRQLFSVLGDLHWVWDAQKGMNDILEVKSTKPFTAFDDWPHDSIVVNRDWKAKRGGKVKAIYHILVSSDYACAMFIHRDTDATWYLDNKSHYDDYGDNNKVFKIRIDDARRHPGVFIAPMLDDDFKYQPIILPRIMPTF